jgi:hypothetical protein
VRVGMETEAYCRRAFDRDLRRIREPVMLVMEPSEIRVRGARSRRRWRAWAWVSVGQCAGFERY